MFSKIYVLNINWCLYLSEVTFYIENTSEKIKLLYLELIKYHKYVVILVK